MCGIFMAQGADAHQQVLAGLQRLEYRGYDSWGIAVTVNGQLSVDKRVGKIGQVDDLQLPSAEIAIGHTRWATHGGVTQTNAHPHLASDGSFALAQNGVTENWAELKAELITQGYEFVSETDTEVIVHQVEQRRKTTAGGDLEVAIRQAFQDLTGRNTIIVLSQDGRVWAARQGSPLVLGINSTTNQVFLSSDTLSFADKADKVVVIEHGQMVAINGSSWRLIEIKTGQQLEPTIEPMTMTSGHIDKAGYDHFMIKEIMESPDVIRQTLNVADEQYLKLAEVITDASRGGHQVYTIGSGTAGIAAAQLAFYLRRDAQVVASSLVGADAVEYFKMLKPGDVMIAPSQSGETADVLEVLEYAKAKGVTIVTYVNMPGSTMTRLADLAFMANAGPEICVMSTKVFTSQLAWGYLVAQAVAGRLADGREEIKTTATAIQSYLSDVIQLDAIKQMGEWLVPFADLFLLAKAQQYQIIREGMVKLIEGTYKHAHAIPAGDLKHYAITLMEPGVPVVVVLADDEVKTDVLTAAHEVKARGATLLGVGPQSQSGFDHFLVVPDTGNTAAIATAITLQLLAYYTTVALGNDVDKPRNIAKSVTVK